MVLFSQEQHNVPVYFQDGSYAGCIKNKSSTSDSSKTSSNMYSSNSHSYDSFNSRYYSLVYILVYNKLKLYLKLLS